jgi:hypothetical protein
MPSLKQWRDRDHLVRDLKNCEWKHKFDSDRRGESKSELETIIRHAVGANTFRAFKIRRHNRPSAVFREWAKKALNPRTRQCLYAVKSQSEYDKWLSVLVKDFADHWNSKMGKMEYGKYFKLVNLLVKRLCLYHDVKPAKFRRIARFLHIPLDSYTIVAIRNCVSSFPHSDAIGRIPKTATMKFVKNQKMYDAFQAGIRRMAQEAHVPPIALDYLAWNPSETKISTNRLTIRLTPYAAALLQKVEANSRYRSPEKIVEQALKVLAMRSE